MSLNFTPWKPMIPTLIADAPASPGVYQLATLVRTVVFIGAAQDNLSETLNVHLNTPATLHPHFGKLYFRVAPLEEPEQVHGGLLEEYRARHRGALPPAQASQPTPLPEMQRRHLKAV